MVKSLLRTSMIPKLCLSSHLIFVIGVKNMNSRITTKITVKFGKAYKNLMVRE
jgi:hypothetical protein